MDQDSLVKYSSWDPNTTGVWRRILFLIQLRIGTVLIVLYPKWLTKSGTSFIIFLRYIVCWDSGASSLMIHVRVSMNLITKSCTCRMVVGVVASIFAYYWHFSQQSPASVLPHNLCSCSGWSRGDESTSCTVRAHHSRQRQRVKPATNNSSGDIGNSTGVLLRIMQELMSCGCFKLEQLLQTCLCEPSIRWAKPFQLFGDAWKVVRLIIAKFNDMG